MTDNNFLDTLKIRVTDSQKRWQEAQQKLNLAQHEFQNAQAEFANWQGALQAEMRRLGQLAPLPTHPAQQPQPVVAVARGPIVPQGVRVNFGIQPPQSTENQEQSSSADVNKTELIRDVLRQHPAGMTPAEIRGALKSDVSRDYVYAVLKRLKDRDEIVFQKKKRKYFMRIPQKGEEPKETIVQ